MSSICVHNTLLPTEPLKKKTSILNTTFSTARPCGWAGAGSGPDGHGTLFAFGDIRYNRNCRALAHLVQTLWRACARTIKSVHFA